MTFEASANSAPKVDPGRTPFRPDPESIEQARSLHFDPPLDAGIRDAVHILIANGVETFESCEGGPGHTYPEPTIRFEGQTSEGLRALSVALENGLRVGELRRVWGVLDGMAHGPWWEITLLPPRPPGQLPWWWQGTAKELASLSVQPSAVVAETVTVC